MSSKSHAHVEKEKWNEKRTSNFTRKFKSKKVNTRIFIVMKFIKKSFILYFMSNL